MANNHERKLMHAKERVQALQIVPKNKKYILDFVEQISADGLTQGRQIKYCYLLCRLSEMMNKDFLKATKQDIIKLCSEINNSTYTEWTKHDYLAIIKRFYKWLGGTDEYPPEVKWIKTSVKNSWKKLPSELLTIEDVKALADATNNLRDRAFVLMLYESGARIGELVNLTLKDIEPDKFGVKVTLFGKTGARKIRLIASAPAINMWIERAHPDRDNKNSMLFCGMWAKKKGKNVEYNTFRDMLLRLAKKVKIDKPVNPHHFRHSRATELAKQFTEAQLCQYMGWIPASREAATYVHLSGRDMDKAVLKLNGLIDEEDTEESKFKATKCPRCGIMNSPESKACPHCGIPLDIQSVMAYEKTSKETLKNIDDPKKMQAMLEVLIKRIEQLKKEKYEGK
jgi:integrase/recombinase XerD